MQKPETPLKSEPLKAGAVKDPLLFAIPNPFDDYLRQKGGWYLEIKKIEEVLKSMRERVNEVAERQVHHRNAIQIMREYCMTMPRKTRNN